MNTPQGHFVYRWDASDFAFGTSYSSRAISRFSWPPHSHAEYCVKICLGGRMEFILDGERLVLESGDMLVHNPGQVHQSCYGAPGWPCEGVGLYFAREVVETILRKISSDYRMRGKDVIFLGKFRDARVLSLIQELTRELQAKEVCYEEMMRSLITQILVCMLRECLTPTFVPQATRPVRQLPVWEMNRAMEYMSSHGKTDFSQAELCSKVGTSHSRFVPLFRNSTGLNPHVYFDQLLMEMAKHQLSSEPCQIKTVAYELGFQDVSHFCKVFRHVIGTSPRQYQQIELRKASKCDAVPLF